VRNTRTFISPVNQERVSFKLQIIDPEHIQVLGMEMLNGTFFSRDMGTERNLSVVINETGARAMGCNPPESITGLKWTVDGNEFTVIGVVKDYNFNSLEIPIEPGLMIWQDGQMKASLRFSSKNIPAVISHIDEVWKSFDPGKPLSYSFLEETFNSHYTGEQRLGRLITIFTIIAVIIACFGVYGISAFMARRMAKNISLRKVMGAETITVVEHFTKEYFWLIIIAAVISIPLGYLYINHWLARFPYQTDISGWIFIVAFLLNLVVIISTILYHALKTATLNPARVLRYE
jgi:putative ABC transport system permease protein